MGVIHHSCRLLCALELEIEPWLVLQGNTFVFTRIESFKGSCIPQDGDWALYFVEGKARDLVFFNGHVF